MENNTIISCQINYYPLNTDKVDEEVKDVLSIIKESGLQSESNALSTNIFGNAEDIYALLKKITNKMDDKNAEFAISMNISNSCGCDI